MSDSERALPESFDVGDWRVDGNAMTVSRGTTSTPLEPRAYQVLRYLAERPGKLVTIDELMDALWAGSVVTPNAVTRVIAQLRKSLGDDAKDPAYIQTVARKGYRFVAAGNVDEGPARRKALVTLTATAGLAVAVLLGWWLWPGQSAEPTVAVLAFENLTGNEELAYLADGVAEEVINTLTQVPDLRVSAQSLSFRFRDSGADLRQVARDLEAAYLVHGSVRQNGTNLRVSAQIIETTSGLNLWSHSEEHDVLQVFAGQDAISAGIAGALAETLQLDYSQPAPHTLAPNPEAYDLYLRGRYIWHRRGNESLQTAIDHFAEAVKIDPSFARGWSALASAYVSYPSYSPRGYATWHLAEDAAKKANELDPELPEAYGVLGTFAQVRGEWQQARRSYFEAIQRRSQSATAHYWYSEHLAATGQLIASAEHLRNAIDLDPAYQPPKVDLAFVHLAFGNVPAGAEIFAEQWRRGMRNATCWTGNFVSAVLLGDTDAAMAWIDAAPMRDAGKQLLRRFVTVDSGMDVDPDLGATITAIDNAPVDYRLAIFMGSRLAANDEVITLLEHRLDEGRYVDPRPFWTTGITLREHPRFPALLARIGLIEYWDAMGWGDVCRVGDNGMICDSRDLSAARIESLLSPESL